MKQAIEITTIWGEGAMTTKWIPGHNLLATQIWGRVLWPWGGPHAMTWTHQCSSWSLSLPAATQGKYFFNQRVKYNIPWYVQGRGGKTICFPCHFVSKENLSKAELGKQPRGYTQPNSHSRGRSSSLPSLGKFISPIILITIYLVPKGT